MPFTNGSYGLIYPVNGSITIPAGAIALTTASLGVGVEASSSGSAITKVVIISQYWFFLENLCDLMLNLHDEIAVTLLCIALVLELPKRFKFPKLPPIINV